MKLWIDDFREPPDDSWTWVKTSSEAINVYVERWKAIEEISFDHDLGPLVSFDNPLPDYQTTMPLARIIEAAAYEGIKPPKWQVHSMNPVGIKNLTDTLTSADRLYKEYQEGG